MSINAPDRARRRHWDLRTAYSLEEMRLHHPAWYAAMADVKKLYDPGVFNEYKNDKDELKIKELPVEEESIDTRYAFPAHAALQMLAAD